MTAKQLKEKVLKALENVHDMDTLEVVYRLIAPEGELENDPDPWNALTPEQQHELLRRSDAVSKGNYKSSPHEDVMRKFKGRYEV